LAQLDRIALRAFARPPPLTRENAGPFVLFVCFVVNLKNANRVTAVSVH